MAKRRPESELPRTLEAFDRWHAQQPERWELINGWPVMMAPGSLSHTTIKGNIFAALRERLRGTPCRVFVDGVEVKSRNLSAIPDVVVACSGIDPRSPVIREPVLIVEVNSPSTERDDTQRKFQGYCLIPSLKHYLVVAQAIPFVVLHTRTGPASFAETVHEAGEVTLEAIGVTLSLEEIYADVTFEPEPEASDA